MRKLKHLFTSATLSGNAPYFDYEYALGREAVIPWLHARLDIKGWSVGDFGCHQGGFLQAFRDLAGIGSGIGFDLNEDNIRKSPFRSDDRFSLEVQDVLRLEPGKYQFDLILIQDTLDHISDYESVLEKAARCLKPGGYVFVSFPPYYSPFGGHQHESANWAKLMPYIHYLPDFLFFRTLRLVDDAYMSAEDSLNDLKGIRKTRLTLSKAEKAFAEADLQVREKEWYLLRPAFKVRYGIPTIRSGILGRVPGLREIFVMGAWYLLQRGD